MALSSTGGSGIHLPIHSVMLVEDHPIFTEGVRAMLKASGRYQLTLSAQTVEDAMQLLKAAQADSELPDLILCDLRLRGGSGLDLLPQFAKIAPRLPVVMLSMHEEALYAEPCLAAGARGYLMKSTLGTTLVGALDQVLAGGMAFSDAMQKRIGTEELPAGTRLPGSPASLPGSFGGAQTLTPREREVFDLIGRGLTNKQIGATLEASPRTIDVHRLSIRAKLGIHSNSELVRVAVMSLLRRTV